MIYIFTFINIKLNIKILVNLRFTLTLYFSMIKKL